MPTYLVESLYCTAQTGPVYEEEVASDDTLRAPASRAGSAREEPRFAGGQVIADLRNNLDAVGNELNLLLIRGLAFHHCSFNRNARVIRKVGRVCVTAAF